MPLEQKDFEEIEHFLKENFLRFLPEQALPKFPFVYEIELRERVVRVEKGLDHQRELLKNTFHVVGKQIEQIEKQFEQRNKSFGQLGMGCGNVGIDIEKTSKSMFQFMVWSYGITVTLTGIIIVVMKLT